MTEQKRFNPPDGHHTSLNHDHILGPARLVNMNELSLHLVLFHNVPAKGATKSELGRLHLLVHAILASPDLREHLNLPPHYGTGKHIPQ